MHSFVIVRSGVLSLFLLYAGVLPPQEDSQTVDPADASVDERPETWAQPESVDGVPNLHRVSDQLYRSAQPTSTGMRNLREMGIETIVNLRSFHSDRSLIDDTGLAYEHISMKAWHPEEKELVRFLQIVSNPKRTPVLVHCQHGADRTGLLCAVYRVVVQEWSKEDAIREMVAGGYGFHPLWTNIIDEVNELDAEDLRRKAGIEVKPDAQTALRL